ncbi:MAG: GAF domain-containing protein [Sphingomicrobium sp.]
MIQPVGFHLSVTDEWLVNAVSANIGEFLPCSAADILGQPLTVALCDDAIHDVRNRMALLRGDDTVEHLLHVALVARGKPFDVSIYRSGEGFGIDAEPSDGHAFGDATGIVEGMLARLETTVDIATLCTEAAKHLRALTGFDRAMICGDGTLLGQSARGSAVTADQAALVPAARDLAVVDCEGDDVAILTMEEGKAPGSRSTLGVPNADETAALRSIGARAALIVPLKRDGRAWGQLACLNSNPRQIGAERRSVVRLFARIIALRIEIAELRER